MAGQLEFISKVIVLEGATQEEQRRGVNSQLEALGREGWMMVPGTTPLVMGVYQLCRQLGAREAATGRGFGSFAIDESKVGILKPDGSMQ